MSTQFQDREIQMIPSSIARCITYKRLCLAFTAVLFSRILLFAAKQKLNSKTSSSVSHIAIDIEPQTSHTKFGKASLSKLVEEENLDQLQCFGGVHEIVVALGTDAENGIKGDSQDLLNRQVVYGSNTYEQPPLKSFFYFALKPFKDPFTILMIVLAIFSTSFGARKHGLEGGPWNAGSIFLAASIVIMSSSFSNFWPYKQFNKLSRNRHDIKVYVLRNGWRQPIPSDQIVVGDVVCLQVGDKIPADGLLLHSHSLFILKPSLAPNSDVIEVNSNRTPFLHSGSVVVNGHAKMLVTSVGMNTTWGKIIITKWKDSSQERTPLQVQLHTIATIASKFGLLAAFVVFFRWSCTYFMGEMRNGYVRGETEFHEIASAMVGILTPVIAIAAGAVAEGLPLAFVIALAYSMKSMANNQAFVQKRSACEVIASATTI